MKYNLTLPAGPSTNNMFKNARRGRVKTHEYKTWIADCFHLIRGKYPRLTPMVGDVAIDIIAMPKDGRLRDVDNYLKATLDLLEMANILINDRQVKSISCYRADPSPPIHQIQVAIQSYPADPNDTEA